MKTHSIVALCKTFSGHEFVTAMLDSIYEFVAAIVLVHSDTGWDGQGKNTVRPVMEEWAAFYETYGKVHNLNCPVSGQEAQYAWGLEQVRKVASPDFIMLIDTDEVWGKEDLSNAIALLKRADSSIVRFTCGMYTYIKSPFFRITPPELCHPTVFLRNTKSLKIEGPRGSRTAGPVVHWPGIAFHHFTYVRETEAAVFAKIKTSTIGDGCETVDLEKWRREKWDQLPDAVDLHTTVGMAHSWRRVTEISPYELPECVRAVPLVREGEGEHYMRYPGRGGTSIIIPTCKTEKEIQGLLDELYARSTGPRQILPICSTGSAAVNRNAGLNAVNYEVVIMVDDDIRDLPYGWNQMLADTLFKYRGAMVSARLMQPNGRVGHLMGGAPPILGQRTVAVEGKLATACVAFRRSELRFDEAFVGSGFEDDDFCFQIRRKDPEAVFLVDNRVMVTHVNEMKNQTGDNFDLNKAYLKKKWRLP